MSSYEFWDELGKIFNAVVAYQEKSIEFNKRFISPWIRLGNVFEKQDRNKEAVSAYERAIEIDGANPQNWFELGNIHFKMENHAEAISAFQRAIELDPEFGLAYSNLALTLVTTGETEPAIALYQKAIELLQDAKDKAVAWNRLGNGYRKLNQYEQALEAFHQADELDQENAGFRDSLDEVTEGPTLMQAGAEGTAEAAQPVVVSPIELIVAESRADEAAASTGQAEQPPAAEQAPTAEQAAVKAAEDAAIEILTEVEVPVEELEPAAATETKASADTTAPPVAEPDGAIPAPESQNEPAAAPVAEAAAEPEVVKPAEEAEAAAESPAPLTEPIAEEPPSEGVAESPAAPEAVEAAPAAAAAVEAAVEAAAPAVEETVTVVVQDSTETFTETLPVGQTSTETTDAALTSQLTEAEPVEESAQTTDVVTSDEAEPAEASENDNLPAAPESEVARISLEQTFPIAAVKPEEDADAVVFDGTEDPAPNSLADQLLEAEPAVLEVPQQVAYEEYLKDTQEPVQALNQEESSEAEAPGSPEPVATLDSSGELQIEMDTKNAHVWNELGNVYFNTSAYDDAIVAYSKAIELDRWFAWPYSNLALAYVQKRRFVEAILLYQRSIELFSSDKDKAISWNRLGNVYRRLNDYENAIAAYQRADALDPDNSTLSLQSRFSLLGNYAMEQKPSYVS